MSDHNAAPASGGATAVRPVGATSSRAATLALLIAGVSFFLYPAVRPFSDEASLQGAAAFASQSWLLAHTLAMAGFVTLSLGLLGLWNHLRATAAGLLAGAALLLSWIGTGLILPYYGAETFGLHTLGQEALRRQDAAVLALAKAIRWQEGLWFILPGLLALAVGAVTLAVAVWRSAVLPKWTGIPLAAGLVLFLPQFFTPQAVRLGHGALMLLGCLLLAWGVTASKGGARRQQRV